ncbi:MAG: hypothetical protein PHE11_04400, partial [Candidatus Omnitrophica bacterium]|nr:hypothetical protein [Candidatus Omnitrophota bacterium]
MPDNHIRFPYDTAFALVGFKLQHPAVFRHMRSGKKDIIIAFRISGFSNHKSTAKAVIDAYPAFNRIQPI